MKRADVLKVRDAFPRDGTELTMLRLVSATSLRIPKLTPILKELTELGQLERTRIGWRRP